MKKIKSNKAKEKKKDKIESSQKNYGHSFDKKKKKEMMKEEVSTDDIELESVSLNEPHPDFILNDINKINEDIVNDWAKELVLISRNQVIVIIMLLICCGGE